MSVVNELTDEIIEFCKKNEQIVIDREMIIMDFLECRADDLEDEVIDALTVELQDHNIEVVD